MMLKLCRVLFAIVTLSMMVSFGIQKDTQVQIEEAEYIVQVQKTEYSEEPTEVVEPVPFYAELTAYCPCRKCNGIWADNPADGVITASGTMAKPNHTIAVDTSVIPFGTVVVIDGEEYVAEDRGGAIKGNKIDVYFDSHADALEFGRQRMIVYLKEGDSE